MPPLTEVGGEGRIFQNSESHPFNWWAKLLGISQQTIMSVARRGGVTITESRPRYPGQPNQRLIAIEDFPKLVAGFQNTGRRADGVHFHPWALEVDTTADKFNVTLPNGKTLIFSKTQLLAQI